ncbi:hypothetical protein CFI00_20625 [Nocardioides sp. S5]|uniref:DUF4012 domain-containing protein n=1 Tax=Nocardioides sp. S5 TaxID=2017486 RepID=UPI001A8FEA5E|nr:DUF4012 domain-containing protein [Nocardioides sp. S5]QSR32860.1 hypothetical protein CFI00_20625 [Nocardioides sp. S5]
MARTTRERAVSASRRRWRWGLATALAVLVAGALWSGWTVWQVQRDLSAARSQAVALPAALAGNANGAAAVVDSLQSHASAAAERTSGPTWQVLSALPALGDDFDATAAVARAVDIVAREGAGPLVDSGLSAETFAPRGGRIPVDRVARAAAPLAEARDGFVRAQDELDDIRVGGLVRELRPQLEALIRQVDEGVDTLDGATRAAELLPAMLGRDGARDYLLVFQNNAEPRSLGGMPGLMAPLRADEGTVTLGRTVAASEFGELAEPVLPLTEQERAIWFEQPGTWFQDSVFIPDFERAGELMAARWKLETGRDVDGVLSVDPVTLSYLVKATGPLTVDGRRLTSSNFVDEILHEPYLRYADDPAAEDAFFAEVLTSTFDRLLDPRTDPSALVAALSRGATEGRLLVHSTIDAEQDRLAGTRVAGAFPSEDGGAAQAGVYVNDATGSKMGYFLDYDARISSVSCAAGEIGFSGQLRIHSSAPSDAASLPTTVTGSGEYGVARGDHLNVFDLVAPTGGEITDVVVNGVKSTGTNRTFEGRPVVSVPILLEPGDVVTLTWRATSGAGHTGGVELISTPGVQRGGGKQFVPAPCGGAEGR